MDTATDLLLERDCFDARPSSRPASSSPHDVVAIDRDGRAWCGRCLRWGVRVGGWCPQLTTEAASA